MQNAIQFLRITVVGHKSFFAMDYIAPAFSVQPYLECFCMPAQHFACVVLDDLFVVLRFYHFSRTFVIDFFLCE